MCTQMLIKGILYTTSTNTVTSDKVVEIVYDLQDGLTMIWCSEQQRSASTKKVGM
jgi:hypothetical protein